MHFSFHQVEHSRVWGHCSRRLFGLSRLAEQSEQPGVCVVYIIVMSMLPTAPTTLWPTYSLRGFPGSGHSSAECEALGTGQVLHYLAPGKYTKQQNSEKTTMHKHPHLCTGTPACNNTTPHLIAHPLSSQDLWLRSTSINVPKLINNQCDWVDSGSGSLQGYLLAIVFSSHSLLTSQIPWLALLWHSQSVAAAVLQEQLQVVRGND